MDNDSINKFNELQNEKFKDLISKYDSLVKITEKLEKIDKILNSELPDIDKINRIKEEYNNIKIDKK